jgi:hypothetical protein
LAETYFRQGRYALCVDQCDTINSYELDPETKRRLDKELSEVASMRRKAESRTKREVVGEAH